MTVLVIWLLILLTMLVSTRKTSINRVVQSMGNMMTLSYIPPWLALLSLVFAILVGMVAGFFPSLRAMRLSPLAAIRSE